MKKIHLILIAAIGIMMTNCHDILDLEDLSAVNETDVWSDPLLAEAYINRVYSDNLPGWSAGESNISDESNGGGGHMYGQLTENSVNYWPYAQIRNINILLTNIDEGSLNENLKNRLKGEAYFFRAWRYFEMVNRYGGIPLILFPQELEDNLLVERNLTSESMSQIISDIDQAINLLPEISSGSGANDGHVHKGTAMAVKGRFLLYYASPQFNPENDNGRWQAAYNANKEAKEYLSERGFGLHDNFENLWFDEMNREAIFVQRYEFPLNVHQWAAATRPLDESQNATGGNWPTWEMVKSFPMVDGTPIENHPDYDEMFFWQNRDPRFQATIAYNGALWELSGKTGRRQWTYAGGEANNPTQTGFYTRKAINEADDPFAAHQGTTMWIELRFAELMLNLAECANAVGLGEEAYAELVAIRARAGIEPGSNSLFGLSPSMNREEMHDAILQERKIELAFESKRHWDLRRNKLFESELNGTRRHGLRIDLKDGITREDVENANLEEDYDQYFTHEEILVDFQFDINWRPEYYFYAIPLSHLQLNSNLEQTAGWPGGTFDPLR
ncbi:RagB/SusD family nutrient uptake outer membrane protein [Lunatibacter salilacus]|uniref:RagB/SusD family nutrient uptake outer membrane protein n=1 Tax=Lunatibacter salilacus TaxID=2483804 RepID=UPI00131DE3FA|nr:RagB/SusD family nutrient uptake outer membrane protein [Lunatibacter salilacus]